MLLLICWNLWKHRNEVIFKSLPLSHSYSRFWRACKVEARIGAADRSVRTTLCAKPGVLLFQICKHHSLLLAPRFFPPLLKIPSVTAFGLLRALQWKFRWGTIPPSPVTLKKKIGGASIVLNWDCGGLAIRIEMLEHLVPLRSASRGPTAAI